MQEFFINKDSDLPVLRMECYMDGRFDYKRNMINDMLQSSDVTFSMYDTETGLAKIANAPAEVVLAKSDGCEERYVLQYKWNSNNHAGHKHDTNKAGIYEGVFNIKVSNLLSSSDVDYPSGDLIVPIQDKLMIYIR